MPPSVLLRLSSLAELRALAPAWDALWRRSDSTWPAAQAEPLCDWLEHFAPRRRVRFLAVEKGGALLAALPLLGQTKGRLLPVASLPGNAWGPAGDLLIDPEAGDDSLDLLVESLQQAGWPLLWFETANLESARWKTLVAALDRAGCPHTSHQRFEIGAVQMRAPWDDYLGSLSANHRRYLRRALTRMQNAGGATLRVIDNPAADQIGRLLQRGFAVEDRSWKGAAGSSVLKSTGMLEFFCGQARQLAARSQLTLVFLVHGGQDIAFEYGWNAKGVYHSIKVGYDEAFEQLCPGQLLRYYLLEHFHRQGSQSCLDFAGLATPATSKWSTETYALSRLVVAPRRRTSRALLGAYSKWRRLRQQLTGAFSTSD